MTIKHRKYAAKEVYMRARELDLHDNIPNKILMAMIREIYNDIYDDCTKWERSTTSLLQVLSYYTIVTTKITSNYI